LRESIDWPASAKKLNRAFRQKMDVFWLEQFVRDLDCERFPWTDNKFERLGNLCAASGNSVAFELERTFDSPLSLRSIFDLADIIVVKSCPENLLLVANKIVVFSNIRAPVSIPIFSSAYSNLEFFSDNGPFNLKIEVFMLENSLYKNSIKKTFINEMGMVFHKGSIVDDNFFWVCSNSELRENNPELWKMLVKRFGEGMAKTDHLVAWFRLEECPWREECFEIVDAPRLS
jgi:hypothetical protein